ncbi:hypothetical protein HC031_09345 [Planosporangium thailandense]|uniref:XRE family transcriptional regulator n=1 Tax=Planosporangium thailandense TaxID=765197 RepID=A0ABX0XV54_9ACTN|nr:hypothetical protein [Planosporangium thailandense]
MGFSEDAIPARVAQHLTAECQIRPRTAWRLACDMSLDLAARHYNAVNGDARAGMRGSRIWEYEQWPDRGVRPTLSALRTLAQVYGTSWKSLLDLRDLEHLPPRDLAEYHGTKEEEPRVSTAAVTVRQPLETGRQIPHRATADAPKPLAEAMILTTTNVDDVQLDQLWSDTIHLGNAYARSSPDSVLRQLSLVRERTMTLLKGRQRPKQTKDLYLVSAKCCAMMGWMSADLGRYGAAQELNSAAWLYAQYVDDHFARRWVRTAQSRVEYWAGNGAESARLAQDGLRHPAGTRMADAPLILAEARGWASIQAERQVLDAIGRWARIEDSEPTVADEDRFFNISKDRRHYMAGTSLLSVGRTGLALKELRTARQVYEGLAPEERWEAMEPMIRIDTGRAYLRLGEFDAAAAELEPFVSVDVGRQPDMVRAMLKVLAGELAGPRWCSSSTACNLVDALRDTQVSVPR